MSGDENLSSTRDNTNYKAIACEEIPELFLDKIVAKKHFSKYGKIKRFILRPKRLSCTVEYENKEDATNALLNAGNFNGVNFVVGYAEHEVAHVQNTEEWVDPEVQAELEAMSPGHMIDSRVTALKKSSGLGRNSKQTNNLFFSPKANKAVTLNKQNSPQPEITKIDTAVRQELEDILKTPAFSYEEKYRVLDARDKLIRLTTVRQTDINKAVATKGTCPDMCPEKERLMREFQRQVSIFEMADENSESTISHVKAVKEYSRSSADQEVPLPHELRSETVLQMTMLYLVHRIMGLCDDPKTSLGEWFHFVWDRTRSIRKDITQQELCSLGAVQLVEQCARFHIHCAARLVAEDPSVFDKKINAENLTKCLQTLKYMYHDLRIKGVVCPCESEFRSYIILLNLGDSNFLWEVKQLPEFIQKSVEIKQAIAFYNALQNNNYVKFFSMIKSSDTSYLSACILLGYFVKLRVRAMDAIIKSHNWRKHDVYLPLSYLTNILGFDDESSAVRFFNHYGLHCELMDKRVLLDPLIKPNIEYAMDRAIQLVESKRQMSVGECIYGEKLLSPPSFENHMPQSSFDDNGMFKMELLTADRHLMEALSKSKNQSNNQQKPSDSTLVSNNEINLFKVPQAFTAGITKQQKKYSHQELSVTKETQDTSLDAQVTKKVEKLPSPVKFKFQDNIFSGSVPTRTTNDSIFKTPLFNIKSEQAASSFFQKPSSEKALPVLGSIFDEVSTNAQANDANIFGIAVKETADIFQKQTENRDHNLGKEIALQEFQRSTENPFVSIISHNDSVSAFEGNSEQLNTLENEVDKSIIAENERAEQIKKEKQKNMELKKLKEEQKRQENREKEINELKAVFEEKAMQTTDLFIRLLIDEEVSRIAKTELLLSQSIVKASERQKEILLSEVVNEFVEDIANEEYALVCYDQLLLNRYFGRWLTHLRKKKEQKKLIENTPLWVTTNTRSEYAQSVKHPCQQQNMSMMKRYRFGKPYDFNKYTEMEYGNVCYETEKLNLFALVGQHLLPTQTFTSCGILQQRKYFKFLITLPENKEELLGFESFANKWLFGLIEKDETKSGPFVNGIEHNLALCVRKFNGIIPKNEDGNVVTTEGDHNDGILCFVSGVEIDTQSRRRLYNLLKLTKNLKRVPLAIIAYNCNCNKEELAELLGLDSLQEDGLIYSYIILGCKMKKRNFNFRNLFMCAVDFITTESYSVNANEIQALAMQSILPFLENSLGEEMWLRWCGSAKENPIFNKICSMPEHVFGIYHKALDHLLHITQEDFDEMPQFPEELREFVPDNSYFNMPLGLEYFPVNWKDKKEKEVIKRFLQSLYMPPIEEKYPSDIESLKLWLLKYTSKCLKDNDFDITKVSHEAISNLVSQIKCLNDLNLSASVHMINYMTVFKPIIFAHINRALESFKKELINLKVIYLKDDLKNYQTQPWWLNYHALDLVAVDYSEDSLSAPQTLKPENNLSLTSPDDTHKIITEAENISCKVEESILEFKRRRRIDNSNSIRNASSTLQVERALDDSLYKFELSKKTGQYDMSFVTELTHDIDESISKVLNQSCVSKKKNKRPCNEFSNVENVIAKASKLIQNIESNEDKKFKRKMYYNYS